MKAFQKHTFLLFTALIFSAKIAAQGVTQFGTPTGQPQFPKGEYTELPSPTVSSESDWKNITSPHVVWASTDVRYAKNAIPTNVKSSKNQTITAWKGERVHAQLLVFGNESFDSISVKCKSDFPKDAIRTSFVRYVMTDELNKDGKGACGHRPDITQFDSSLVADVLDHITEKLPYHKQTVQPVWVQVQIPQNIATGKYKTSIEIADGTRTLGRLNLTVNVLNRTLETADRWAFHLDLWQNPYAEARYFQVEPWSEAHFEAMRPTMELLARSGQKVITATIMHKPWGGQTHDAFGSMVGWTKRLDGSWQFDFSRFDRWVEFMMSCGIRQQINCYSMIPWSLSFRYYDQAHDDFRTIEATPNDSIYAEVWGELLRQFSTHLRAKGWFDITTIAMDERPKEQMLTVFEIIRKADPEFKVSLAGDWHEELESELHDYCIAFRHHFPNDVLQRRKERGQISTYYTCCTEPYPNTFTFSQPAEAEYLGWYAAAQGLDGYLRWAYNSYTLEPLLDSRFRSFAAGDCYIVYPEGRSSIRFERLTAGIQAFEKIRLLRQDFLAKNQLQKLGKLNQVLQLFSPENLTATNATEIVTKANRMLQKIQ